MIADPVTRVLITTMIPQVIALAGVLFVPNKEHARVELNWGGVRYSSPVSFTEAHRLDRSLVDNGIFSGQPQSIGLEQQNRILRLSPVYDREYAGRPRESLPNTAPPICQSVFPGQRVIVWLCD